eukprot:jgi/Hompol1/1989/HPOL_002110-RA
MLVFRDVGVQLCTRRLSGVNSCRFIPLSQISGIIIHEGITMFQVKFYLAIIVKGEDRLAIAFQILQSICPSIKNLLPRLHVLERIYADTRATLLDGFD